MKITLGVFSGAIKALHPKLLPDAVGVDSRNQKPGRGDFQPWRIPAQVATVPDARLSLYRMGRDVRSDANYWCTWPTRVHVMRGYDAGDTTERTYFTGDGTPKWVDNTFALAGAGPYPVATRELGIPAAATAPVLSGSGGVDTNTHSVYVVYTYVSSRGDESAPSPSSAELVCKTDDAIDVASIAPPPAGRDIDRIRVYATVSGESGDTEFFFQLELASSASSGTIAALQSNTDVLETDGWLPPPADLSCLTPMWNGMAAGISGNGVQVCPAFALYAWPIKYQFLPPDAKPVGLGRWGEQNLLVLTTGRPCALVGTGPDSLDLQPVTGHACSSEPSIVGFDHGVVYACEDGLAYYNGGAPVLLTQNLLTRDDWQAMNPTTMSASRYEGGYLCFYTDGGGVRRGFLLDPANPQGMFFLDAGYTAAWFDDLQDALFVLDGPAVKKWHPIGGDPMTATFVSKVWVTGTVNFRFAKVTADAYPVTLMVDAGPFTAEEQTNMADLLAQFPTELSWVGNYLRATHTVASGDAFELHAGFEATEWQVTVQTANAVQAVVLATTAKETA